MSKPRVAQGWSLIFYTGVFLIPFDNLAVAPSMGWAAVAPYIFGLSAFLALLLFPAVFGRAVKLSGHVSAILLALLFIGSLTAYIAFGVDGRLVLMTALKVILGYSFLISIVVAKAVVPSWEMQAIRLLTFSYFFSLCIGLVQLSGVFLGINPLEGVFDFVFARYYPDKVQFTFTEPSFASLHVFGVVVPFLLLGGLSGGSARLLRGVGLTILFVSVLSGSSLRALFDTGLVASAFLLVLPARRKFYFILLMCAIGLGLIAFMPNRLAERLDNIGSAQQILDPSAAIRKFRVNAAVEGTFSSLPSALIGYGFGNSAKAMEIGFDEAYAQLPMSFDEIDQLKVQPDGLVYSMHGKLLAEHGVVFYLAILLILLSRKHIFFWMLMLIVYLQFDSYAFYAVWLYFYARIFALGKDVSVGSLLSVSRRD